MISLRILLLDLKLRDPQHLKLKHQLIIQSATRIINYFLEVPLELQLHFKEVTHIEREKLRVLERLDREVPHDDPAQAFKVRQIHEFLVGSQF